MIIVYSNTEINQKAVAALLEKKEQNVFYLPDISLTNKNSLTIDPDDDILTIVDLNANGKLQKLYAPRVMVQNLNTIGFLNRINTIQLLVSDVVPSKSMQEFAINLSRELLSKKPETPITVRVPAHFLNSTLILPPEDPNGAWTVYSGAIDETKSPPSQEEAIGVYKSKMQLVFSGSLEEAFQNPDYEFSPESTRETYGAASP